MNSDVDMPSVILCGAARIRQKIKTLTSNRVFIVINVGNGSWQSMTANIPS